MNCRFALFNWILFLSIAVTDGILLQDTTTPKVLFYCLVTILLFLHLHPKFSHYLHYNPTKDDIS